MGADSCTAKREGVYVRRAAGPGVDTVWEAVALAYMVLRDLRRGYTYDPRRGCRRKRMTRGLARRRLEFIVRLARMHGATPREIEIIKAVIRHAARKWRLPAEVAGRSTAEILERYIVVRR